MNKTLILGLGSEILTDDGIGLRIVNDLKSSFQIEKNLNGRIDFETALTGSLDLLEIIKDYCTLIIIDAIKTKDGIPGQIFKYSIENYINTIHLQNIHDISFTDTLKLGKSTGMKIPDNVEIIAIEIIDNLSFGTSLSEDLESKYPEIFNEIKNLVENKIQVVNTVL